MDDADGAAGLEPALALIAAALTATGGAVPDFPCDGTGVWEARLAA